MKNPTVPHKASLLALCCALTLPGMAQTSNTEKFSHTPGNPACKFFDGFIDNADGTVTDPRNGLIWKRCAEGSIWQGTHCTVNSLQMNWFDAMAHAKKSRFQGHTDWQLPSQSELQAVMGKFSDCKDNSAAKGQFAASTAIAHASTADSYSEFFWTSTPHGSQSTYAWDINLVDGSNSSGYRDYFSHVRLVRLDRLMTAARNSEFDSEFALLDRYRKSVDQQNESNRLERLAIEEKRKAETGKTTATRQLLEQGAQMLYLQAAKAQRQGTKITFLSIDFTPAELYEMIIENFPLSEVAVRASDQLDRYNQSRN